MKHRALIDRLTLEEKHWSTRDIPSKGIPATILSDGPRGLHRTLRRARTIL